MNAKFRGVVLYLFLGGLAFASPSYEEAVALYQKGDYAKARQAFAEIVQRDPQNSHLMDAEYYAAMTFFNLGQYEPFAKAARDYLKKYPSAPQEGRDFLRYNLAMIPFVQRQWAEARAQLETYRASGPSENFQILARYNMIQCLLNAGLHDEFRNDAQEFIRQYPNGPNPRQADDLRYSLARSYFIQNRWSEARKAFDAFVAERPTSAFALECQCWSAICDYQSGNYDTYKQTAEAILAKNPKGTNPQLANLRYFLALVPFNRGQYVEAGREMGRFVAENGNSELAGLAKYYELECLYNQCDYDRFKSKAEDYIAKNPAAPNLQQAELLSFMLAMIPFKQGNWPAAAASLDKYARTHTTVRLVLEAEYNSALAQYFEGNYDTFQKQAAAFLKNHPAAPRDQTETLRLNIAMSLRGQMTWRAAEESFKSFLDSKPGYLNACSAKIMLGRVLIEHANETPDKAQAGEMLKQSQNWFAQALDDGRKAMKEPEDYMPMTNCLEHFYAYKDFERVLKIACEIRDAYPASSRGWAFGQLWFGMTSAAKEPKDRRAAIEAFEQILKADFKDPNIVDHTQTMAALWLATLAESRGDKKALKNYVLLIKDKMPEGPVKYRALKRYRSVLEKK